MRILHLVHQYPPDHMGGTELYTQAVAQELSRRNETVSIFTRQNAEGNGRADCCEADVAVHRVWNGKPGPRQRFLSTFGNPEIEEAFETVLDQFQPELVHIQHLMGLPASLLVGLRRRGIPFVITLHDFWWICANAQLITNYDSQICDGPSLWLNCARCALARGRNSVFWPALPAVALMFAHRGMTLNGLLNQAVRIIAPSQFVKDWYVAHGVNEERIQVLKHGIQVPSGIVNSRNGSIPPRTRRFLYAGGLAWQKGVHVLLDAFLNVDGPGELWIAGDESFDPAYSQRLHTATAHEANNPVRFLGKLSRDELWQTLGQVDAVVVPALWYETFSLIVHEAFAAGVPVVASRLGALAEGVRHGIDGLLVEPGNVEAWRETLQQLIEDPGQLYRLRKAIRPPMSLEEHVSRLHSIYLQAIRSHAHESKPVRNRDAGQLA